MSYAFSSATGSLISSAFQGLGQRTALRAGELDAFERQRAGVTSSLTNRFAVSKFVPIGSVVRGSGLTGSSDLDLLVVLRREEVVWGDSLKAPSTVLSNVRTALRETYPSTEIGRDGQAVVVRFTDGRSVDVVPGWWASAQPNGWPLYAIPSGGADWLKTAPDLHNKYISDGDDSAGGKLKSVVRIMKYWRSTRAQDLPLSGFHLELLLTSERTCVGARSLASCVAETLALLERRSCRALQDPCGVSGLISSAGTEAKRERLLQAISSSSSYAQSAIRCEQAADYRNALYYWELVFNGKFQ